LRFTHNFIDRDLEVLRTMTGPSYIDIFDGHIALLSDDMSDMDLMKDQGQGNTGLPLEPGKTDASIRICFVPRKSTARGVAVMPRRVTGRLFTSSQMSFG